MAAMVANAAQYRDVEIVHQVPMGDSAYLAPALAESFRHNSLFAGGDTRAAIAEGRADFTPVFFSQIPDLLRGALPVDVALVNLSPPDAHGYCSFGVSVDYTKPPPRARGRSSRGSTRGCRARSGGASSTSASSTTSSRWTNR